VNHRPLANYNEIRAHLTDLNRDPFMDVLAKLLHCAPDEATLTAFADEHPDRWANAISQFAKMSGFHDKMEITNNVNVLIGQMGDAQLLHAWEESQKNILDLAPEEIKIEDTVVEEESVISHSLSDPPS
jgi:hypothetical protein